MVALCGVIAINLVFLYFVFYRRLTRTRYLQAKDAAKVRFRPVIANFFGNAITVQNAADVLAEAETKAERDAIREMLFAGANEHNIQRVTELLQATAHVAEWARQAFGKKRGAQLLQKAQQGESTKIPAKRHTHWSDVILRRRILAVPRSIALDRLGHLNPGFTQPFLAEGLLDPSPEVRRIAIIAMGRNRQPDAIPFLVEELRRAAETGNDVSLRNIKGALVCYRIQDLPHFVPFILQGTPRFRFLMVDVVREVCNETTRKTRITRNNFPQEFYELMLDKVVKDPHADVRARSAAVICHFRDARAIDVLRELMNDPNEYVRLHAVRSAAGYRDLLPDLLKRLTDSNWRVREGATKTLAGFGDVGSAELYRHFIKTSDRYSSEQIADELQRSGLIKNLVKTVGKGGSESELSLAVCRKMAQMQKSSMLTNAVATMEPEYTSSRMALMDALSSSPSNEYLELLQILSKSDSGPVGQKAVALLNRSSVRAAAAGSPSGVGSGITRPSGTRPPGSGTRPPGSGTQPPPSGTKTPGSGSQTPSSGSKPSGSQSQPPSSDSKPPEGGSSGSEGGQK